MSVCVCGGEVSTHVRYAKAFNDIIVKRREAKRIHGFSWFYKFENE